MSQPLNNATENICFFNPNNVIIYNYETDSHHPQCCDSICAVSSFEFYFVSKKGICRYNTLNRQVFTPSLCFSDETINRSWQKFWENRIPKQLETLHSSEQLKYFGITANCGYVVAVGPSCCFIYNLLNNQYVVVLSFVCNCVPRVANTLLRSIDCRKVYVENGDYNEDSRFDLPNNGVDINHHCQEIRMAVSTNYSTLEGINIRFSLKSFFLLLRLFNTFIDWLIVLYIMLSLFLFSIKMLSLQNSL